jgi:MFS family permease
VEALTQRTRVLSLAVICLGSAMPPMLVHSSTLGIPLFSQELELSARTISWFPLALVLGNAIFQFPAARLGDRFGRKRIFATGLLITAGASALGALSTVGWEIIACRFFQGIGNAFTFATGVALIVDIATDSQRARMLGLYTAACYLGITSGPLLGGTIIQYLGWRAVFYLPVPCLLLTALVCFNVLNWESYGERSRRFDFVGMLTYGIAICCIAPALQSIAASGSSLILAIGVLFLAGFAYDQYRKPLPLVDVRLLVHNSRFGLACLAMFLVNTSVYSIPFVMTLYLQYVRALSPQETGTVLMLQAIVTAVVSPLGGKLAARFTNRRMAFVGLAGIGAGLLVFAVLNQSSPDWLVPLALMLVGAGIGLFEPLAMNFAMSAAGNEFRGGAAALVNSMRLLGAFVSLGLISAYLSLSIGGVIISAALHDGLSESVHRYFIGALLAISLAACAVWRIRASQPT